MEGRLLSWRKEQPKGRIMSSSTFKAIEEKASKKYGKERGKKVAGTAYWKTARSKFNKEVE